MLKKLCSLSEVMKGVEIKPVPQGHPAFGSEFSRGLYATRLFTMGDVIGQYAGVIDSGDAETTRRGQRLTGQYSIELDIAQSMGHYSLIKLDAKHVGNESRFINDFRGVPDVHGPNIEFVTRVCPTKGIWVDVKAKWRIQAGEELLVDYGDAFGDFASS